MCGIAGVLHRDGSRPPDHVLEAMAQSIAHRGPDGQGVQSMPGCGLAHRRLAVIDLSSAASQPMRAASGKSWIVFNGEIYNFLDLRRTLEQRGCVFRTNSDTEVILAAWETWGEDAIAKLDGMFAFALWDEPDRRLVLARDRTGKKPLYIYEDDQRVIFASEIKAILAHPGVDSRMSPEAVPQFLSHGYVPTPRTFYARIRKLPPATYELFSARQREPRAVPYWDIPTEQPRTIRTADELRDAEGQVRKLFFEAVQRRLVSDVPLGAFLSGGIDSTVVVAAMASMSAKPVKTFSIGFDGYPAWDETKWARLVADRYRTEHTEFKVKPESLGLLDKLAWHYDEPFGDSSAIPTYIVSKLTRQQVTVALTGDGGDELFAGYPRFMGAVLAERIPRPLRRMARHLVGPLPHGREHQGSWERARRFALQASQDLPERLQGWVSVFTRNDLQRLLRPEVARFSSEAILGESYRAAFRRAEQTDTLNQILYANARTYLLDDLNVKMDRASMAASLESRAPFLDTKLIEYVSSLPGHVKLRGAQTKWILKRALRDLIPVEILTRKKMGFGVPLGAWFRDQLSDELKDSLLNSSSPLRQFLVGKELENIATRHLSGQRDYGLQAWSLLMLDRWLLANTKN